MKMSVGVASVNKTRAAWWQRLVWSLGAATGLLSGAAGTGPASAVAQGVDYRSAAAAPAAWREFATQLQGRFQQRLAADDAGARKFQDFMAKRDANAAPLALVVRTWVLPNGKVEQIEFDGLDDDDVVVNLRALIATVDASAPPPDMLQPLHLRLSLHPKDQPQQGQ